MHWFVAGVICILLGISINDYFYYTVGVLYLYFYVCYLQETIEIDKLRKERDELLRQLKIK